MQSRDFEQFCEVMMNVNIANESSEGWTESSSDAEAEPIPTATYVAPLQKLSQRNNNINDGKDLELYSSVFNLRRQTVRRWANFARKTSI